MSHAERLLKLAKQIASEQSDFLEKKGPGRGDHATISFMKDLRTKARQEFREDFAEQQICGPNAFSVDYYFPREATIVELAFGLSKPQTEFEKDVLKAIMSQEAGHRVTRLFFISKPGATKKCAQPGRSGIIEWAKRKHGIAIEVHEL